MNHEHSYLTASAARALTLPTEPWLSCEDCFDLMDAYVDGLLAGSGSGSGSGGGSAAGMRVHLRACPACAEEAESLLLLVAEQDGVDPGPALSRMSRAPEQDVGEAG